MFNLKETKTVTLNSRTQKQVPITLSTNLKILMKFIIFWVST